MKMGRLSKNQMFALVQFLGNMDYLEVFYMKCRDDFQIHWHVFFELAACFLKCVYDLGSNVIENNLVHMARDDIKSLQQHCRLIT